MIRTGGRASWALIVMTALAALLLAACDGSPSASSASSADPTGNAAAATPTVSASGSTPVLSDEGLGDLKLGDSLKQARALGLITPNQKPASPPGEPCTLYRGRAGAKDLFFMDGELIIIAVSPEVRLDTGVGVGSTYQDLHDAYGDRVGEDEELGRIYVTAPGAPFAAHYRIGLDTGTAASRDTRITEIALQSVERGCYE